MPGTFILRPIEAKLTRDTELIGKMDPYCMFRMGGQSFKSTTSQKGGTHPQWQDSITMPMPVNPTETTMCSVEIRDENVLKDDSVGSFEMDMTEVKMQGKVRKWFSLYHKDKPAGDLLLEATYMEMMPSTMGTMEGMPMGTMGTTGTMGTMGSMHGTTGTMPSSQMGTMGMTKDPMMMHGGMSTGMPMGMGTMGSMHGTSGTMPSSQMGTMGMSKEPTMMHGGMTTGQMGTNMPSSQMSMNQDPMMMHGGMTGTMGSMESQTRTMTCDQSGMTCTNPMHQHDKMKKD